MSVTTLENMAPEHRGEFHVMMQEKKVRPDRKGQYHHYVSVHEPHRRYSSSRGRYNDPPRGSVTLRRLHIERTRIENCNQRAFHINGENRIFLTADIKGPMDVRRRLVTLVDSYQDEIMDEKNLLIIYNAVVEGTSRYWDDDKRVFTKPLPFGFRQLTSGMPIWVIYDQNLLITNGTNEDAQTIILSKPVAREEMTKNWVQTLIAAARDDRKTVAANIKDCEEKLLQLSGTYGVLNMVVSAVDDAGLKRVEEAINEISAMPLIESVSFTAMGMVCVTKTLNNYLDGDPEKGKYGGKFEIVLNLDGLEMKFRNIAAHADGFNHPHGSCTGTYQALMQSAMLALDFKRLMEIALDFLQSANSQDYNGRDGHAELPKVAPKKTFTVHHFTQLIKRHRTKVKRVIRHDEDEDMDDED